MNGKLFAEIYGIVEAVIPNRHYLPSLQYMVIDEKEMIATDLDVVVKVRTKTKEFLSGNTIVNRDDIKSVIPTIKKTNEIVISDNKLIMDDVEQRLQTMKEDKYPEYNNLLEEGTDYRFLFSTSDIHLTGTLIDRMLCMAKGIAKEDYRPALMGYIIDPEGHFIYTTDGHVLFGTDYSSVADKVYMGEDNLDTFTMPNISKILKKVKNINTIKMEDSNNRNTEGGWVRFTIYCDYYTVEITARKVIGAMAASTIKKVIPIEHGDNTMILSSESIDRLVGLFGKIVGGVKFQKVDDEIVCTAIGVNNPTVFKIHDTESKFEAVGFNVNFLKSISDFYRCSMVEFNFKSTSGATRANIFDNDDIAIVMPVRLSKDTN